MSPIEREKRVNLLVTKTEQGMLRALAEREGTTMSDYLRRYVRREYAATFGDDAPKAAKARKRK